MTMDVYKKIMQDETNSILKPPTVGMGMCARPRSMQFGEDRNQTEVWNHFFYKILSASIERANKLGGDSIV